MFDRDSIAIYFLAFAIVSALLVNFSSYICGGTFNECGPESEVFRNFVLAFAALIGLALAGWRLWLSQVSVQNDKEKLSIDRLERALKLLSSDRVSVRTTALHLLRRISEAEEENSQDIKFAIYRFFQEDYLADKRQNEGEYLRESSTGSEAAAYQKWNDRPLPEIYPTKYIDLFEVEDMRGGLMAGYRSLSFRGSTLYVNDSQRFIECDMSKCKVIIDNGCDLIGCDLTSARIILRKVRRTEDLQLYGCNLSDAMFEPAMPSDYCDGTARRFGWCWKGQPPVVGDNFGLPLPVRKVVFSFEDSSDRQIDVSQRPSFFQGKADGYTMHFGQWVAVDWKSKRPGVRPSVVDA